MPHSGLQGPAPTPLISSLPPLPLVCSAPTLLAFPFCSASTKLVPTTGALQLPSFGLEPSSAGLWTWLVHLKLQAPLLCQLSWGSSLTTLNWSCHILCLFHL